MLNDREKYRYDRHLKLKEVGIEGQGKFKFASVLVVGAGGLGVPVLQYLTAAGIGKIGIVDGDLIDLSNLQRQVIYSEDSIGYNKAEKAAEILNRLNSQINITPYSFYLKPENAIQLFSEYDLIVDATDDIGVRYLINDTCVLLNKIWVYGAIHKYEGQVSVFNFNNGPTYRDLFPTPPNENQVPDCNQVGVLGVLAGMVGTEMANQVLKVVLQSNRVLSGQLKLINSLTDNQTIIKINKHDIPKESVPSNANQLAQKDYSLNCIANIHEREIDSNSLNQMLKKGWTIADIREKDEMPRIQLAHKCYSNDVLLEEVQNQKLDRIIVVCQGGFRSLSLTEKIKEIAPKAAVISLKGGIKNLTRTNV